MFKLGWSLNIIAYTRCWFPSCFDTWKCVDSYHRRMSLHCFKILLYKMIINTFEENKKFITLVQPSSQDGSLQHVNNVEFSFA
jgi:hypothetical protein